MSENTHTNDAEVEPYEVNEGSEMLVRDTSTGELYAGQWVENIVSEGDGITLGYFDDPIRGPRTPVRIPEKALYRHIAFTGETGYGKSTAVRNHLQQLATRGHGFAFFDPKGTEARSLLSQIPEDRVDDVVWVSVEEESVGFNIFETSTTRGDDNYEEEVQELTEAFIEVIKARVDGWGKTTDTILRAITVQLIRSEDSYTPIDLYKILNDEDEREWFVETFGDEVEEKCLSTLTEVSEESFDPLLRRLLLFVDNKYLRELLCAEDGMALGDVIQNDRILIADTGNIKKEISAFGVGIVTQCLWATAKTFGPVEPGFFVTFDEFDYYASPVLPIGDMISKGRSLRFGSVLAFQSMVQLPEDVEESLANVDNFYSFNTGRNPSTAAKVAQKYDCSMQKIMELEQFSFMGRIHRPDGTLTDPYVVNILPQMPPVRTDEERETVIANSVENYSE